MNRRILDKQLEILALVLEQDQDVTFVDVDRALYDREYSNYVPDYFLYKTTERKELIWVFFDEENLEAAKGLLETDALRLQDTATMTYARDKYGEMVPTTSKKFETVFQCDNWVPTVLIKGPNFKIEWEKIINDTSRKVKKSNRKQQKPSSS